MCDSFGISAAPLVDLASIPVSVWLAGSEGFSQEVQIVR